MPKIPEPHLAFTPTAQGAITTKVPATTPKRSNKQHHTDDEKSDTTTAIFQDVRKEENANNHPRMCVSNKLYVRYVIQEVKLMEWIKSALIVLFLHQEDMTC
jgi:hypothetical protein